MTDRANVAATFHRRQVDDARFGYTQGDGRWGTGPTEWWECEGVSAPFSVGDRDCSSSVIDCWREALRGSSYEGALDAATYTGDMRAVFVGSGLFDWHPMGDGHIAKRGDIYLNEVHHTAMCQSAVPDMLSEYISNEFGGIVGGQSGDQTGGESLVRAYYDFPWNGILAYNGNADGAGSSGEWVRDDKGWWYKRADGSWPANEWLALDAWYRFGADGYALTGWQMIDGKWYLFGDDCRMLTGWQSVGGKWYWLDYSGAMRTGWLFIDNKWYWLDDSGAMRTGWLFLGGKWYWLDESGAMAESTCRSINGKWYAFDSSGVMISGEVPTGEGGDLELD